MHREPALFYFDLFSVFLAIKRTNNLSRISFKRSLHYELYLLCRHRETNAKSNCSCGW